MKTIRRRSGTISNGRIKNKEVGQTTTTKEITIRKEKGKWKVVVDENLQNAIINRIINNMKINF